MSCLVREIQAQERKITALETTVRHMESDIARKQTELQRKNSFIYTYIFFFTILDIILICLYYDYIDYVVILVLHFSGDKQKISVVCDYKNFDETLLMQSKIVKDLQDQRGVYAYQATAYKEYIKKLSVKDPCCPLCHRDFQEQQKVADLIQEMETDIIRNQPGRLKKCEGELKSEQKKYDNMLQLKPIVERIIQSEENDLKKLE